MSRQLQLAERTAHVAEPFRALGCTITVHHHGRTCRQRTPLDDRGAPVSTRGWCGFCKHEQGEEIDEAWMRSGPSSPRDGWDCVIDRVTS